MHPKSARETVGKHKSRETLPEGAGGTGGKQNEAITPPEGAGGTGGKQNKAIKLPEGAGGSVGNHKRKGTQGTGDNTKKVPGVVKTSGTPKYGGDLLSQLVCQYHRRARA